MDNIELKRLRHDLEKEQDLVLEQNKEIIQLQKDMKEIKAYITSIKLPKPRKKRLSSKQQIVLDLHNKGMKQIDMSRQTGYPQPTIACIIHRLRYMGYIETGD